MSIGPVNERMLVVYFDVKPNYILSENEHRRQTKNDEDWLFREKTDEELKADEICEKFYDNWKERHKLWYPTEFAVLLSETDDRIKNNLFPKIKYLFENGASDNHGLTPTFQITTMSKNNGYIRVTSDYDVFDHCCFGHTIYKDWKLFRFVIHFKGKDPVASEIDESNIFVSPALFCSSVLSLERIITKNKSNPDFDYMELL